MLRTTAGLVAIAVSAVSGFDLQRSWLLLTIAGTALVLSGLDHTIPRGAIRIGSTSDGAVAD